MQGPGQIELEDRNRIRRVQDLFDIFNLVKGVSIRALAALVARPT